MKKTSNYILTAGFTYGWWYSSTCSTSNYDTICEIPMSSYQCPPAPPPLPPAITSSYNCELRSAQAQAGCVTEAAALADHSIGAGSAGTANRLQVLLQAVERYTLSNPADTC